ncbi:MAG: nuclear transport factor 2 family protein, partial [Bacteroidetes bacterium]|nr:nuclear transport factor 2 family protein [Bacteroidota bacterium]
YKISYPDKTARGTLEFTILTIRLLDDETAIVLGQWQLSRPPDNPNGYFSLVFKKLEDGWKIIYDHSS